MLVVEDGRIVEDGSPAELRARSGSHYGALFEASETVRTGLWQSPHWRRLRLDGGRLVEHRIADEAPREDEDG